MMFIMNLFPCPKDLVCSPRMFTKITKPIIATLQKKRHAVCRYLVDLYIMGNTFESYKQAVQETISLLTSLGFHVNFDKSHTTPTQ